MTHLKSNTLAGIARQAAAEWNRGDLTRVDRAARTFLALLELRQVPEAIPPVLRAPFTELWDSFGAPSARAAEAAHAPNALDAEQLERCEVLTRRFAAAVEGIEEDL